MEIDQQRRSIRSLIDGYSMVRLRSSLQISGPITQLSSISIGSCSLHHVLQPIKSLFTSYSLIYLPALIKHILSKMHASTLLSFLPLLASTFAAPVDDVKRTNCPSYTIINTRGTGEPQGQSSGFRTMNSRVTGALSGGKIHNTVYAAGASQNSAAGTTDIVNKVASTLRSNPNECIILEGYSQGAQATVNAMSRLTGASFNAVKGVVLIGSPAHRAGLACNVDNNGGTATRNVNGMSARAGGGIPSNWVSKTRDICIRVSGTFFTLTTQVVAGITLLTTSFRATVFVILQTVLVLTHNIFNTPETLLLRIWVPLSFSSNWLSCPQVLLSSLLHFGYLYDLWFYINCHYLIKSQ